MNIKDFAENPNGMICIDLNECYTSPNAITSISYDDVQKLREYLSFLTDVYDNAVEERDIIELEDGDVFLFKCEGENIYTGDVRGNIVHVHWLDKYKTNGNVQHNLSDIQSNLNNKEDWNLL